MKNKFWIILINIMLIAYAAVMTGSQEAVIGLNK